PAEHSFAALARARGHDAYSGTLAKDGGRTPGPGAAESVDSGSLPRLYESALGHHVPAAGRALTTLEPEMPVLRPGDRLLLATTSAGKQRELRALLGDLPLALVTPADLGLTLVPEETGTTFAANAALKAHAY